MLAATHVDAALASRKRPRSPAATSTSTSSSTGATTAMDQQRLLSFAHFTTALRDAHRPIASTPSLVLPGISHLLNMTPQQSQQQSLAPTQHQRVSVSGDFIARQHVSPIAAAAHTPLPASPAVVTTPVSPSPTAFAPTKPTSSTSSSSSSDCTDDMNANADTAAEDKTPWPSASEYHALLTAMPNSNIPVYDLGTDPRGVPLHPESIYSAPVSCMYFLKCTALLGKGSFGFPRKKKTTVDTSVADTGTKTSIGTQTNKPKKEASKAFEWRKMSFVTGLPKKQPVVRYITATCYSRASQDKTKQKVFRMHAVMLADVSGKSEAGGFVLVHIRAGGSKRVGLRASVSSSSSSSAVVEPTPVAVALLPSVASDCDRNDSSNSNDVRQAAVIGTNTCTQRPVSPLRTTTATYSSTAASTSPQHKKLLHVDFADFALGSTSSFAHTQQQQTTPPLLVPMARHPLMATSRALPSLDETKVSTARQAVRDLIRHACSSRDEVATYVQCLQQELAALQQQQQQQTPEL